MNPKRPTVFIKMKPYLKAFLISILGNEPIFIPQNQDGNYLRIIEKLLIKPTVRDIISIPDDKSDYVEIMLPCYKYTNISIKNFLSQNSQKIIEQRVNDLFWEAFYVHMTDLAKDNVNILNATILFIEKHNIPFKGDVEEMLRKGYYRRKNFYLQRSKRQYIKNS